MLHSSKLHGIATGHSKEKKFGNSALSGHNSLLSNLKLKALLYLVSLVLLPAPVPKPKRS